MKYPEYPLLGVTVNALTLESLRDIVVKAASENAKYIVGNHNLHSVYLYHHDPEFRRFYRHTDYVHVDGMPLIWAGKLLGYPLKREHRMTYVDLLGPVLAECSAKNLRVFFLGSKPGIAEKAAARFVTDLPDLQVKTHHGYFDSRPGSPENERVLREIGVYRPHVLMVGMGMPYQEAWILRNLDRLEANTIWNAGAFMDYFAGATPTPPRWMGRLGLEWLHRLLSEPGRLWRRYILEPPFVLWLFIRELARRSSRPG